MKNFGLNRGKVMAKLKKAPREQRTSGQNKSRNNVNFRHLGWMTKFIGFCIVAVREMAYTLKLVYKNFYSMEPLEKIMTSSIEEKEVYQKITCAICSREFNNNDTVVKCPEKDFEEVYHYICWIFSHGCTRPGCLANMENPHNLILH